jgi:hypothetical protein
MIRSCKSHCFGASRVHIIQSTSFSASRANLIRSPRTVGSTPQYTTLRPHTMAANLPELPAVETLSPRVIRILGNNPNKVGFLKE